MEVNRAVADLGWTPEGTKLTMRRKNGLFPAKEAKFRSAHRYNWTLSKSDQQRIDEVGNYMASFADLPFVEYRNAGKPLTRAQR